MINHCCYISYTYVNSSHYTHQKQNNTVDVAGECAPINYSKYYAEKLVQLINFIQSIFQTAYEFLAVKSTFHWSTSQVDDFYYFCEQVLSCWKFTLSCLFAYCGRLSFNMIDLIASIDNVSGSDGFVIGWSKCIYFLVISQLILYYWYFEGTLYKIEIALFKKRLKGKIISWFFNFFDFTFNIDPPFISTSRKIP